MRRCSAIGLSGLIALVAALALNPSSHCWAQKDGFVTSFTTSATTSGITPAEHSDAFVAAFENPDPCSPSCVKPWSDTQYQKVGVPGKGEFVVQFRTRENCLSDKFHQFFIDAVFALNSNGVDPFDGLSLQEAIPRQIIPILIAEHPLGKTSGLLGGIPPIRKFEAVMEPCWTRVNTGSVICPVQYLPCGYSGEQCCKITVLFEFDSALENIVDKTVFPTGYDPGEHLCVFEGPTLCEKVCIYIQSP